NTDFHLIVDFVEASHIRYALTFNPTVYVYHIRQFWSTARIETTEEGTKILATVGGKLITVSESSIRRNLKLNDEARISSLPDAELFKNLTLMGYNISPNQKFTFQKGQFSHKWKYLIHTIMQCLSPKSTAFNKFSSNIATALVCLATNRVYNFSKMIFDGMATPSPQHELSSSSLPPVTTESLPTVIPSDNPPLKQYTWRTRIAQSSVLPPVADEPASPLGNDSQVIQHQGLLPLLLMRAACNLDEGEEAAKKSSNDTEEMVNVITSLDAAIVLTSGVSVIISPVTEIPVAKVPTGSGSIPTASPPGTGVPTGGVPTGS
nr:synaptobrevin, longin-like domain protein [Tanacetum cinerariifolium]